MDTVQCYESTQLVTKPVFHCKQENNVNVYHFIDYTVYSRIAGGGGGVDVATCYGLNGPGIESRWRARFCAPVQTASVAPPSLLFSGYRVCLPGAKRPGHGVNHPTPIWRRGSRRCRAIALLPLCNFMACLV